jgi:hypothetical protein
MTRLPHPALAWVANLLVPGAGLVLIGRLATGLTLGIAWGAGVCGLLITGIIWPDARLAAILGAAAALAFVLAQVLLGMWYRALARHRQSPERDARFKEALAATLQGRLDDAEVLCRALLKADPEDVEATLHLATLARERGNGAAARSLLARTAWLDDQGRWDDEVRRELAALEQAADTR